MNRLRLAGWIVPVLLVPQAVWAQPHVEEQVLGPLLDNFYTGHVVSPRGQRLASLVARADGGVVIVDGVEGPAFDELLSAAFVDVSLPPEINDISVLDEARRILNLHREDTVVFSADGSRYAYACRIGGDAVIVVDGKEFHREPLGPGGLCHLRFSPGGKHVYFVRKPDRGDQGFRLVMDGTPLGASYLQPLPVFSPGDGHYAYVATDLGDPDRHTLIVDGNPAAYSGVRPEFASAGALTTVQVDPQTLKQTLLLDGAPVFTALRVSGVYPDPLGQRLAAVGDMGNQYQQLFIDGTAAGGAALIDAVVWSPDGKHYAALCQSPERTRYVILDGQNGPEFQNITDLAFAPDSSRLVYVGLMDGQLHAVFNNADVMQGAAMMPLKPFFYGPDCKAAFIQGQNLNDLALVMGDEMLGGLRAVKGPAFSPDGTRRAFVHGQINQERPVVDQTEYPSLLVEPLAAPAGGPDQQARYFVFSPDNAHVVFLAASRENPKAMGLFVDGTLIPASNTRIGRVSFTPDSRHLLWTASEKPFQNIYVDGEVVARYDLGSGSQWESNEAMWDMSPEGVFTIMGPVNGQVKRFRITPPAGTSIETMIAGAAGR
ncbi:MAG: hypothetical protein IT437_05775 [Phycisphaerales bacterium]|nr:hypothetical protein [Phycisphaerales bacterium]